MIIKKELDDCMDNNVNVCIFYKCNKSYILYLDITAMSKKNRKAVFLVFHLVVFPYRGH